MMLGTSRHWVVVSSWILIATLGVTTLTALTVTMSLASVVTVTILLGVPLWSPPYPPIVASVLDDYPTAAARYPEYHHY